MVETLSKGMAQKIQFLSTIIAEPEIIVLDEPFSGLDPVNLEVLREAVLTLRKNGATIIFSTHDMFVAERMCDRIFMIYKGRKVLDGTQEEIQTEYGQDTLRIRTSTGASVLEGLDGVEDVRDHGQLQELRFTGDTQKLLHDLLARTEVHHFEQTRPSLHDIFVRIAKPDPDEEKTL
jgi:ABC-2 type transport system ATP-binding protein